MYIPVEGLGMMLLWLSCGVVVMVVVNVCVVVVGVVDADMC